MKTDNPLLIHFIENRQARIILVVLTLAVSLIITAMILKINDVSIAGMHTILFPTGLLWFMPELVARVTSPSSEGGGIAMFSMLFVYSLLGWILYFGLALFIILATKPRTVLILYVLLTILFVTNIAGCNNLAGQ